MQKIVNNEIIGAVKLNGNWRFFSGIIAEWIMDYSSYDPAYNPDEWETPFRNNILLLNECNAIEFCEAMSPYEIVNDEIETVINEYKGRKMPQVVIDFDAKEMINQFFDIAIEDYIPKEWTGKYIENISGFPPEVKTLWSIA